MRSQALAVSYRSIAVHSRSFALASRFLPGHCRDAAVVLYAWCRRADDAVDHGDPAGGREALERLRREVDAVYAGASLDDPVLAAFQEVVSSCYIPRAYPEELLAGLEMDVQGVLYDDLDALLRYCWRVAGTVGLMMCHVMGVRHEGATRNAVHLGIAMQLTNICRDVELDWSHGRLYLPRDMLEEEGAGDLDRRRGGPLPADAAEGVARVIRRLLGEADRFYASGEAGLPALSWRCALAIRVASRVYAAIGTRLNAMDCDPRAGRAVVSGRAKARLAAGALADAVRELPARGVSLIPGVEVFAPPRRRVRFPRDILPLGAS
jgi:phytoene synthase